MTIEQVSRFIRKNYTKDSVDQLFVLNFNAPDEPHNKYDSSLTNRYENKRL